MSNSEQSSILVSFLTTLLTWLTLKRGLYLVGGIMLLFMMYGLWQFYQTRELSFSLFLFLVIVVFALGHGIAGITLSWYSTSCKQRFKTDSHDINMMIVKGLAPDDTPSSSRLSQFERQAIEDAVAQKIKSAFESTLIQARLGFLLNYIIGVVVLALMLFLVFNLVILNGC